MILNTMVMAKEKKTESLYANVRPEQKAAIQMLSDVTGMKQVEIATRLVAWFAGLPTPVQKGILWPAQDSTELEMLKMVLEHLPMLSGAKSPADPAAAKKEAARLLDLAVKKAHSK